MRELFARPLFFPEPWFAWLFAATLLALTVAAAVYDTRKAIIPKWVSLGLLAVGVVLNTVRGALVGGLGQKVWVLGDASAAVGGADGFLFALAGFAFGFALYFVMWIFGVCGGGDVKLMSALGAWLGPYGVVLYVVVSTAVLFVWVAGNLVFGGVTPRSMRKTVKGIQSPHGKGGKLSQRRVTFSFPAAVSSLVILVGVFGEDLGIRRKPTAAPQPETAHVVPPASH